MYIAVAGGNRHVAIVLEAGAGCGGGADSSLAVDRALVFASLNGVTVFQTTHDLAEAERSDFAVHDSCPGSRPKRSAERA